MTDGSPAGRETPPPRRSSERGPLTAGARPSPAQPSPAQPSPAQPSPAQPSPAQPSPAQPSPAQPSQKTDGADPEDRAEPRSDVPPSLEIDGLDPEDRGTASSRRRDGAESEDRVAAWLDRAAEVSLAALLLAGGALFVAVALRMITYPQGVVTPEGAIREACRRLAAGHDIYAVETLRRPPFLVAQYPPLFYAATALLLRLFGDGFWAGRLVSSLSSLATAGLLGTV